MKHSISFLAQTLFTIALIASTFSVLQAQKTTFQREKPSKIIDISNLEDGEHVLTSDGGSKILFLITDGVPFSIGRSINGQFHPFRLDSPCADYIAMPCSDGSAPATYYDPYEKQCVAVCENFVGLLLPAVQSVREAARRN